jgi:predicted acyltransferase
MAETPADTSRTKDRLLSLDVFRGLTMFLLIAESTNLYEHLVDPSLQGTLLHAIGRQFDHHPWNGLRFWDLIQPFFMFIVGVALPFSVAKREQRGDRRASITWHAVRRAVLLLLLGWALYCIGPGRITFRFQNVLAQLSVTYLIAYLMMRRPAWAQVAMSLGLVFITEVAYRAFWVQGFDQPFVPDRNFGAWVDLRLSGELSSGHWVSFNAIPTTAHTIWGVLAGQCLRSAWPHRKKIAVLGAAGAVGLTLGFALTPVSPIIKRICTASFVVASGGFCLLALALCYWVIDVKRLRKWAWVLTVVGMNSLFIYLFTESGGTRWIIRLVRPFTMAWSGWTGKLPAELLTSLAAWAVLWLMCYWLYRRKIVIAI